MSRISALGIAFLASLLPAASQDAATPNVPLLFTVTDAQGKFVPDLEQRDFDVFENRRRQETVVAFRRVSGLPLRLGILVDTRYSKLPLDQPVLDFLRRVLATEDKAFLVGFDTSSDLIVDFTSDMQSLAKGIRSLRPGSGAVLHDAVFYACWDKLQPFPPERFRRALLIVTDGDDTQSRVKPEQALEIAQRTHVSLFSISPSGRVPNPVLDRFAEQTGGLNSQNEDLQESLEKVADELLHQYFLVFTPKPFAPDGRLHEVEIQPRAKDLRVRSRKGYYAPSRQP